MKQTPLIIGIGTIAIAAVAYLLWPRGETLIVQPQQNLSVSSSSEAVSSTLFFASSSSRQQSVATSSTSKIESKKSPAPQEEEPAVITDPKEIERYIQQHNYTPVAKIEQEDIVVYAKNPPAQESGMTPPTMPAILQVEALGGRPIIVDSKILQTNKSIAIVKTDAEGNPQELVTVDTQKEQNKDITIPLPPQIGE